MKKIILISAIAATGLFADMMTDMAKDAAVSKAKSEVKTTAVKEVAGDDAVKKTATPDASTLLGGATKKETSLEDKAVDMAAEKAVGSNPLKKAAAKEAIKSAI